MPSTFFIGESIHFGWCIFKRNVLFFIALLVIFFASLTAPQILITVTRNKLPYLTPLFILLFFIIEIVLPIGMIKIALNFCSNEKAQFSDLFSCFPFFFRYLLGLILYTLLIVGGCFLLVIPGIIWSIKYQFFVYGIVDKNLGVMDSLRHSARITNGAKWDLLALHLVLFVLSALGIVTMGIGLFVMIPVSMVTLAFVYRKLASSTV